jgi:hypothetical protein
VPPPAVIPAPQAYTNVAVVKTFVVHVSANLCESGSPASVLRGDSWDRRTGGNPSQGCSLPVICRFRTASGFAQRGAIHNCE